MLLLLPLPRHRDVAYGQMGEGRDGGHGSVLSLQSTFSSDRRRLVGGPGHAATLILSELETSSRTASRSSTENGCSGREARRVFWGSGMRRRGAGALL